jgi:hypothetical protein
MVMVRPENSHQARLLRLPIALSELGDRAGVAGAARLVGDHVVAAG